MSLILALCMAPSGAILVPGYASSTYSLHTSDSYTHSPFTCSAGTFPSGFISISQSGFASGSYCPSSGLLSSTFFTSNSTPFSSSAVQVRCANGHSYALARSVGMDSFPTHVEVML
eukprot:jgi/Pico_ML_1/50584/g1769.t1